MTARISVLLLGLWFVGGGGGTGIVGVAQAQKRIAAGTVLARFGDARALAVDPRGRLYVADAARDVVEVFGPDGRRRMVLGGSGTRPGEFDTPSDVEPTNGQVLLVADTYNGRLQRFSEDGQYLESLPIGKVGKMEDTGWRFEDSRGGTPVQGTGRPIAVVRDDGGGVYVLDRRERRLLKWSDVGRLQRIASRRSSRLRDPVGLAVGDGRRLYVADAGQEGVLVFDTFGTFRRRVPLPPLPQLKTLTVYRGRLWVVCAERVLVWDRKTGLVARHTVDLPASLVDAAPAEKGVYLLTPTRLRRRRDW